MTEQELKDYKFIAINGVIMSINNYIKENDGNLPRAVLLSTDIYQYLVKETALIEDVRKYSSLEDLTLVYDFIKRANIVIRHDIRIPPKMAHAVNERLYQQYLMREKLSPSPQKVYIN